jgi:serine O-acetyltransferase
MDGSIPQRASGPNGDAGHGEGHEHGPLAEAGPRDFAGEVVQGLLTSYRTASGAMKHVNSYELPSMEEVARIVDLCRTLLYPGFVGGSLVRATDTELREFVRERVDDLGNRLRRQTYRGLHHKVQSAQGTTDLDCPHCAARAADIAQNFLAGLVHIRSLLALDVEAHLSSDPAATGTDEIIFCYPGLYAITVYRLAHALLRLGGKLIPRMMTELAHEKVGIDIHPGAQVGQSFFIDHGTGVVIGETTVIGDRVRIYQGVTIGAMSVKDRRESGVKRHPTIEDDVVIYAGATILGGDTVVGRGAVVGGNCWVTQSVPAGAVVTQDGIRLPRSATQDPVLAAGDRPRRGI